MQPQSFGQLWIRQVARRGKIKVVRRTNLDRGTSTQLREAQFDTEDWNYVLLDYFVGVNDPDLVVSVLAFSAFGLLLLTVFAEYAHDVQRQISLR